MAAAQPAPNPTQSGCTGRGRRAAEWTTVGGALAALGVCASCCLLPLVLIAVGAGGAWAGTLQVFAPYKWAFVAAAAVLLAYAFYAVYRRRPTCGAATCATCRPSRTARVGLWAATILAVSSVAFDYLEPALM